MTAEAGAPRLWRHPNGVYYVLFGPRLKRRVSTLTRDPQQAEEFLSVFGTTGHASFAPRAPASAATPAQPNVQLPGWPRGLPEELAAAYVGASLAAFRAEITAGVWPVGARVGNRRIWGRNELDRAVEAAIWRERRKAHRR